MYANLVTDSGGRRPPVIDDRHFRLFCFGKDEHPPIPMTETEQKTYVWYSKGYSNEAIRNRLGCGLKRVNEILDNLRVKRWIR